MNSTQLNLLSCPSTSHPYPLLSFQSNSPPSPHYLPVPPSLSLHIPSSSSITISPTLPNYFSLSIPPSPSLTISPSPSLRAGAISPEQAAALNILIEKGDDRIKRVFTVYEADKDVYKLIDALKIFNIQSQVLFCVYGDDVSCQLACPHHSSSACRLFTCTS